MATTTPTALAEAVSDHGPLERIPLDPSWILDGSPEASTCRVSEAPGKVIRICACTEGALEWRHETDETLLILEGCAVIEHEDLPARRFSPGDAVFVRGGTRARWRIDHYVKKIAFARTPAPARGSVGGLLNALKRRLFAAGPRRSIEPIGACGVELRTGTRVRRPIRR